MVDTGYLFGIAVYAVLVVFLVIWIRRRMEWHTAESLYVRGDIPGRNDSLSVNPWLVAAVAFSTLATVSLGGVMGVIDGALEIETMLAAIAVLVLAFVVIGLGSIPSVRSGIWAVLYRFKVSVLFRRHPNWSMLVSYGTIGTILILSGMLVAVLWLPMENYLVFIAALGLIATVTVFYVSSTVRRARRNRRGLGERGLARLRTPFPAGIAALRIRRYPGRFNFSRSINVVRGWVVALFVFSLLASLAWGAWLVGDVVGLLGVLVLLALLVGSAAIRRTLRSVSPNTLRTESV